KNHAPVRLASSIGGTKKQIKVRIHYILNNSTVSARVRWKSRFICIVLGIMLLLFSPDTSIIADSDDIYSFHEDNIDYEDLSSYFQGYEGSVVIYDTLMKQYTGMSTLN